MKGRTASPGCNSLFLVEAGIDAVVESIKRGWRYQVGRNCLYWPWIIAGAGELRSHIWGTGCNMGACCILQGDGANALVLGRTSDFAGVSVPHFPISTVHVQRLSVTFIAVYMCLLFPQAELWSSGLDFHLDEKCYCCPSLHQERAFPLQRKGQKIPVCVCLRDACFEKKAISCQNPIRRGVLKMVWYLKGSPSKRQSPGSIFRLIFSYSVRRSGSYVLPHRRLSMMAWYPFTSKFNVASNPSFLLSQQAQCWFRGCLVPEGFAMNQNKGPLWAGLHTVSSLPEMFLMDLPSGTKALLKTDPNPSQVIQVTLYYLGAFWCGLCAIK